MKHDMERSRSAEIDEMLRINEEQARFYDREVMQSTPPSTGSAGERSSAGAGTRQSIPMRLWQRAKQKRHRIEKLAGMGGLKDRLHHQWVGDPAGKRILDLGCGRGHRFSFYLAEKSGRYLGIDLSSTAVDALNEELDRRGLDHAEGRAIDFLDPDFPEGDFDIVHARSVIHHFRYLESFLQTLYRRMAPGGIVLTFDPLQTAVSARLARAAYRPFQEDRAWEWPLTRRSFDLIVRYFEIEEVQGLLGKAKWAIPVILFHESLAEKLSKEWHQQDLRDASTVGSGLWPCLLVMMKWRRRDEPVASERPG